MKCTWFAPGRILAVADALSVSSLVQVRRTMSMYQGTAIRVGHGCRRFCCGNSSQKHGDRAKLPVFFSPARRSRVRLEEKGARTIGLQLRAEQTTGRSDAVAPMTRNGSVLARLALEGGEVGVEVGYGLNAAEIVFEGNVFVGGMRVFIGKAEADQDAWHLEGVVHLGDEGNRAALANEHRLFTEAFFERCLSLRENGGMIGRGHSFAGAQHVKTCT